MSTCGGSITTLTINVTKTPQPAGGALESRTRHTIRAGIANAGAVWIVTRANAKAGEGFPIFPGESFQFDDRGARAAVWVRGDNDEGDVAHIITEGA